MNTRYPIDYGPDEGMLSALGYKVGKTGKSESHRHKILTDLFYLHTLPNVENREQWGEAKSAIRLNKMANTIYCLKNNSQNNDPEKYKYAIEDWKDDLDWLKDEFYDGNFDFPWPSW